METEWSDCILIGKGKTVIEMSEQKDKDPLEGLTVRMYKGEKYLNMTNAAAYVGYTIAGFRRKLKAIARAYAEDSSKPRVRRVDWDTKEVFVNVADLDKAFAPRELSDDDLLGDDE
jgi:hypothetical protein